MQLASKTEEEVIRATDSDCSLETHVHCASNKRNVSVTVSTSTSSKYSGIILVQVCNTFSVLELQRLLGHNHTEAYRYAYCTLDMFHNNTQSLEQSKSLSRIKTITPSKYYLARILEVTYVSSY